jgi:hypothetical protein
MTGYPEGRSTFYPFRASAIPLDRGTAQIVAISGGGNTACAGQPAPTSSGAPGAPTQCSGPANVVMRFSGFDANRVPFSGSTTLSLDYYYSPGGGGRGGGGAGCYNVVTGGTLTLTY